MPTATIDATQNGISVVEQAPEGPAQSVEDIETASVLEEMLKGKTAPEPGDFMSDRVINQGDDEVPAQVVADSLVSAGYLYVYDTKTGQESIINRNMLPFQMRKRHAEDGTRAFTLVKPNITPVVGTLLCLLHKDAPGRSQFDRYGFKTCPKRNLMTEFDVDQHMKARHKKEWASIQADRTRQEKEEDRAIQRQMMASLTAVAKANREPKARKEPKSKAS